MTPPSRLSLLDRLRAINPRVQIAAVAVLLIIVAVPVAAVVAFGGEGEADLVARPSTETPTPTPSPSPSPTPTPTATPPYPWPADPIPPGEPAGLVNVSSIGFPLAPPSERTPPGNEAGIVRIVSEDLGMNHYVETLGIENGKMLSPDEDGNHSVGWYASDEQWTFGVPGEAGNSVFSAHETWNHMQGPFYLIHQAKPGDDIYLEMADGERRHYQVARITRYPVGEMPMREVLWPSDRPEWEDWITLYTCGGEIVYDSTGYGDYLARDVLVAKWVGSEYPDTVQNPDGDQEQPETQPAAAGVELDPEQATPSQP